MKITTAALVLAWLMPSSQLLAAEPSFPQLEELGEAIYANDNAASLATDRLMESGEVPRGIRGWVTLQADDGVRVVFVEGEGDSFCTRLSVLVGKSGAGPLRRSKSCQPLTPEQRAMFLARQTALAGLRTRCSEDYNTVVLPRDKEEGAWVVYLLAATKDPRQIVLGGHVRALVREGGLEVSRYQPLSNACLTMEAPSSSEGKAVAVAITHVLDDHPNEMHVFLSLLHKTKFYVLTESAMWSVAEGKIKLLMDGEDYKSYVERAKAAAEKKPGAEPSTSQ
jgi:hypothetical protein